MNIVAVSAEPEYVTAVNVGGGAIDIIIEVARLQVDGKTCTGSLQLSLLAADVDTLTRRLAELLMEAQREYSMRVSPADEA